MEGMFLRKKFNVWLFLLFLCGLTFIGMYIFLNIVDPKAPSELLTFLIVGILIILVVIPSWLLNFGAFIQISENSIKAKYHWFGKLNCKIGEVAFAMAQVNTLTILLKNGKRHIIMGVENAWPLAAAIRQQIFTVETEKPDTLLRKLEEVQAARKKKLYWVLGCVALMFANIFIAVLLTGGKEMYAFSNTDWILFSIMGVVEILTVILTFYFAGQCGKQLLPIEHLKYRLKGAYIATTPLPAGIVKRVYTDANHMGRIVICGYPNDESVYYCVQEFVGNYLLKTVDTSEIYENEDNLPNEALSTFIDISDNFQ